MVVCALESGREQEKLKERFFLLIAISPNSSIEFGFEIDRFVIILVLRFVVWRSCYQETRGWDDGFAVVPLARAYGGCLGRQYR